MLNDLPRDLRYGLRGLRRSPGFTAMVALTLALGIGANAAIFSLVNAVLLRSLPVRDPARLVLLSNGLFSGTTGGLPDDGGRVNAYSQPLYTHLRAQPEVGAVFAGVAAQEANRTRSVVRWDGAVSAADEAANGRLVSANYFDVIGVGAARGRLFSPEDEATPGGNPVVVLSDGYWQRRFGGDPAVLGARLEINGGRFTVIGITAPSFTGTRVGEATDLWIPLSMQAVFQRGDSLRDRDDEAWLVLFGRLQPGATIAAADASLNLGLHRYLTDVAKVAPSTRRPYIAIQPGATGISQFRETFSRPLLALWAGVGLLLLIVCLNVSHLLLARAIRRQREMSIRTALGASRARLAQQLLTEGLLLAVLGATLGLLFSRWLSDGLGALVSTDATLDGAGGDPRVFWFTAGLALSTALVLGLVPAWQAARSNLIEALQTGAQAVTAGGARRRLSRFLLASQVAFSMVLLVGAGLLAGTLDKLRGMDKGYAEDQVLLLDLVPRYTGLDQHQALVLYEDLVRRIEAIQGVRSASLSLGTGRVLGAMTHGREVLRADRRREADAITGIVTPGFIETMGMTLLRGRSLSRDDHGNRPRVAVISDALARQLYDAEDPIGKRVRLSGEPRERPDVEIVGVVKDARTNELRKDAPATLFVPVAQAPEYLRGLQVRTHGDPALLADQIRAAVHAAHPNLPVLAVRTLHSRVEQALKQERLLATLSTAFGAAALFLVCIGLYGVISEWAALRTREIGVRMALGATGGGVRWLVLRQAFALVLAGLAVGLPAAIAGARWLESLLFGLAPMDPAILSLAALVMLTVAALAAYLPARRASRVDPMRALRAD